MTTPGGLPAPVEVPSASVSVVSGGDGGSVSAALDGLRINLRESRSALGIPLAILAAVAAAALASHTAPTAAEVGRGVSRLIPIADVALAAAIAALLVLSPWEGLVAWVAAMGVLTITQSDAVLGGVQIILSTVMLAALAVGTARQRVLQRRRANEVAAEAAPRAPGAGAGVAPRPARTEAAVAPRARSSRGLAIVWALAGSMAALAIASALVSPDRGAATTIALHGLVEPALLGALVFTLRPTRRQLTALAIALVCSVALASIFNLLRLTQILGPSGAAAVRIDLARFTYYNVGIFGDLLAIVLPIVVGALLLRRDLGLPRVAVVLAAVAAVVCIPGLYFTYSKSAWIGAGIAIFLVLLLGFRSWRIRLSLVGLALVASALLVPYPAVVLNAVGIDATPYTSFVSRIQGGRLSSWDPSSPQGQVSINERAYATEAAFRMALDHPLLGVGPGRFASVYPEYKPRAAERTLTSAHDFIPDLAAEYGIPLAALTGIAIAAALVGMVWVYARRRRAPSAQIHSDDDPPAEQPRDRDADAALAVLLGASIVAFTIVATTFGLDFYRPYRLMNSDVLAAALLIGSAAALVANVRGRGSAEDLARRA